MPLPWLQHLKIPFQEIKSLTNNFDDKRNKIGEGGFGKVYKGEHSKHGTVAIKRLEPKWKQGTVQFLNEITILSRYLHENLISLVGFCDDNGEMIIVYKYALNESLDKWLSKESLTWMQRLKICVGVARGLHYLHTCPGHQQRIIHRDIKSANILLNEKWEAKISDFGLSKLGPKDQEQSFVVTGFAGTPGYFDPQYKDTSLLREESDVFSFGVVLLEVLCSRINSRHNELVILARFCFERGEPDKLVDETLLEQIETKCLNKFAAIAYKCVSESHETRPPMHNVVGELEKALRFQETMKGTMPQHVRSKLTSAARDCTKSSIEEFDGECTDKVNKSCSTRLVEGDGTLNVAELARFIEDVKLAEHGVSYAVVSIMGPQSSGKSTLLNELFGTNFEVMDDRAGIYQTTEGIWMAKCPVINPCTIILDLEGTDTDDEREREEVAFEKQSALFVLAVSDIVLINIWCHEIGRERAARKPLLRTVFRAMLQTDVFTGRKITLLFVVRDKSKIPLDKIKSILMEDVHKIWDSVPHWKTVKKPELSELFNVEVNCLSKFELPKFKEEVRSLRKWIINSIAPGSGDDRRGVVPASGFSLSVRNLWAAIKENKYLDLPANGVMVASILCQKILEESLLSFVANEDWNELEEAARSGLVPRFRKRLDSLIQKCLIDYDKGTAYLEEGVRSEKRKQLEVKIQLHVRPTFKLMLKHSRSDKLAMFKKQFDNALKEEKPFAAAKRDCTNSSIEEFDRECTCNPKSDIMIGHANSDSAIDKATDKLRRDMDAHITQVRAVKLSELTREYKSKIDEALRNPVKAMLNGCGDHTWAGIRKVLQQVTETDVKGFRLELSAFEIDEKTKEEKCLGLSDYALQVIESTARAEAQSDRVLQRMSEKYMRSFFGKEGALQAVSMGEDTTELIKTFNRKCLKLLSSNAAIQLEDGVDDDIWNTLERALLNNEDGDGLNFETWKQVPESKTLISPAMCNMLWSQFRTQFRTSRESRDFPKNEKKWPFNIFACII